MFTRIVVDIEIGWNLYDVPGARLPVVRQVDMVLVVEKTQWNLDKDRYGTGHWKQIWALHCFINQHEHHQRENLVPCECPGSKLHDASLLVKGEVGHVYRTGRLKSTVIAITYLVTDLMMVKTMVLMEDLVNGGGNPKDLAVRVNEHVGFVTNLVVTVSAEIEVSLISKDLNTRTERNDLNPC